MKPWGPSNCIKTIAYSIGVVSNDWCTYVKSKFGHRDTQREQYLKSEAEVGMRLFQCQRLLPTTRRSQERGTNRFSFKTLRRNQLANTRNFEHSDREWISVILTHCFVGLCYGRLRYNTPSHAHGLETYIIMMAIFLKGFIGSI